MDADLPTTAGDVMDAAVESDSVALARIDLERQKHEATVAADQAKTLLRSRAAVAVAVLVLLAVTVVVIGQLSSLGKEIPDSLGTIMTLLAGGVTTVLGMTLAGGKK
jgi:hypothetical protein